MEEVSDEPLYRDRVCGIDIGKAGMVATIRVPSDSNPARRAAESRSFGTTRREVLALAGWVISWFRASMLAGAPSPESRQACWPSSSDSLCSSWQMRAAWPLARSCAAARSARSASPVTAGPLPAAAGTRV